MGEKMGLKSPSEGLSATKCLSRSTESSE